MKIKILFIVVALLIVSGFTVYAQDDIVCTAEVNNRDVIISGHYTEASGQFYVTLVIGETLPDAIHVYQIMSEADGSFAFDYTFAEDAPKGRYKYTVTSVYGQYTDYIEYLGETTNISNGFFYADIDINISNYVPTLSGTISCQYGKSVNINIANTTDNTIIADEIITYNDGEKNVSYTLPSLFNPKEYRVIISCSDGTKNITAIDVTIDSSIVLVSMDGSVELADNVQLLVNSTGLIETDTVITESKSVSATIPNLVGNATIQMDIYGVENIKVPTPDYDNTDMNNAVLVGTNQNFQTVINSSLAAAWFKVVPKRSDVYTINTSNNFDVEMIEVLNGVSNQIELENSMYLSYPKEYYFKVTSKATNGGTFSINISLQDQTPGTAFKTSIGSNTYHTSLNDGGRIYKNGNLFSNSQSIKGITWLCNHNETLYFNYDGNICRLTDSAYEVVNENTDARYIISDGDYIYFSNWSDSGRIYKGYDADGSFVIERLCSDSASWLIIDGEYIYYKNGLDGNTIYKVSKTALGAETGEKVR